MPDRSHRANPPQPSAAPRSAGSLRTWIEVGLLVTGIALLAVYVAAQIDRHFTSRLLLDAFPAGRPSATATLPDDRSIESGDEASAQENGRAIDSAGVPLAVLRIPRIHLDVPVLDGTDSLTLNHAAGRIEGTALPGEAGNIGIAAHRDSFFRGLGKLRLGDPIELETPQGVRTYIVQKTQVVMPDNVAVLDPRSVPSLTLVTCYPFHYLGRAPQRYIVTASLQPSAQETPQPRASR